MDELRKYRLKNLLKASIVLASIGVIIFVTVFIIRLVHMVNLEKALQKTLDSYAFDMTININTKRERENETITSNKTTSSKKPSIKILIDTQNQLFYIKQELKDGQYIKLYYKDGIYTRDSYDTNDGQIFETKTQAFDEALGNDFYVDEVMLQEMGINYNKLTKIRPRISHKENTYTITLRKSHIKRIFTDEFLNELYNSGVKLNKSKFNIHVLVDPKTKLVKNITFEYMIVTVVKTHYLSNEYEEVKTTLSIGLDIIATDDKVDILSTLDNETGPYYFNLDNKTQEYSVGMFSSYKNIIYNIQIPQTYKGLPVTRIDNNGFSSCNNVAYITLPNSITHIDSYAFKGCSKLYKVNLPDSLNYIGDYAFEDCTALSTIYVPANVTYIGKSAFQNCKQLYQIRIPNGITKIEDSTFFGTGITTITIPDNVISIGNYAFKDCVNLNKIKLPVNLISIGDEAFSYCTNLKSIEIPNSVTHIGSNAFYGCSKLENLFIPSVTTIDIKTISSN